MQPSQPFQPWLLDQLRNAPQLTLDYLNAALDESDPTTFVLALKNAAEAHGGIDPAAEDRESPDPATALDSPKPSGMIQTEILFSPLHDA